MTKKLKNLLKKKPGVRSDTKKVTSKVTLPSVTIIVEAVDIKPFRSLMVRHNIKIVDEKEIEESPAFVVESNETEIEELLVSTQFAWEFA